VSTGTIPLKVGSKPLLISTLLIEPFPQNPYTPAVNPAINDRINIPA